MAIESDQLQKRYLFGQAAGGKVWDPEQRSVVLFRISDQPQYDAIIQNRSTIINPHHQYAKLILLWIKPHCTKMLPHWLTSYNTSRPVTTYLAFESSYYCSPPSPGRVSSNTTRLTLHHPQWAETKQFLPRFLPIVLLLIMLLPVFQRLAPHWSLLATHNAYLHLVPLILPILLWLPPLHLGPHWNLLTKLISYHSI